MNIIQPPDRGVDFVGQVIKPWRRSTRRRTFNDAIQRVSKIDKSELFETANSYFGLLGQSTASHADRAKLAKVALKRGFSVSRELTKTYVKKSCHRK